MPACAVLLALVFGAQPSSGRVFVDAGGDGVTFSRAVAAEVSGVSTSTASADAAGSDVLVTVRRENGSLALTMRTQSGELIINRTFDLAGGEAPATRQAVLAVAAAIVLLRERAPSPAPVAEIPRVEEPAQWDRPRFSSEPLVAATAPPATSSRSASLLSIAAGGAMTTIDGLSNSELGFRIAAEREVGPIALGLAFEVTGICCDVESPAMTASLRRIDVAFYGRWPLLELEGFSVGPEAVLGVGHDRLRATATAFVGDAAAEEKSSLRFVSRAGVSLRMAVAGDWLLASASGGADIRAPSLSISLPPGFPNNSGPLDTGIAAAYAQIGVVFRTP